VQVLCGIRVSSQDLNEQDKLSIQQQGRRQKFISAEEEKEKSIFEAWLHGCAMRCFPKWSDG